MCQGHRAREPPDDRTDACRARLPCPNRDAFFCAVPIGTPVAAGGLPVTPSAGPYYVLSYTPMQQVVLGRNPNYRGPRPHRLGVIVYTIGVSKARTVAQVEAGEADYAADGVPPEDASRLDLRYGRRSAGGRGGKAALLHRADPRYGLPRAEH